MDKAIELTCVTKDYIRGKEVVHALNGVTLNVDEGEFLAVVGPSGSGKTTLLQIVGCVDKPTSGEVRIAGMSINSLNENELARVRRNFIGFVFQQFFLMPTLTARENVLLPTLFSGTSANPDALLELVGLKGRANHYPTELSGGEMQRVAIARALVNNPQILLADEPTGNLDSKSAEEIFGLLRKLSKEGVAVVVVTHNLELAKTANRIVKLSDGKIVGEIDSTNR